MHVAPAIQEGVVKRGDKNTKFFHQSATQRRRQNFILEISDNQGNHFNSDDDIARIFKDHFMSLFSTSNPTDLDPVLSGVHRVVSDDMNAAFTREFTANKVEATLKQMAPSTAPGPNGMSPLFYQSFWELVGLDVSKTILSSLNSGSLLKAVNHTYITLIPKTQAPQKVLDYPPLAFVTSFTRFYPKSLPTN